MSTDEKVETHEDGQSCEVAMSKKQRKRLLKSERLKETKSQWRYQLYAQALKITLSNVGQSNELRKKKGRENVN